MSNRSACSVVAAVVNDLDDAIISYLRSCCCDATATLLVATAGTVLIQRGTNFTITVAVTEVTASV